MARRLLDDDEEGRPLLLRQGSKDVHPLGRCCDRSKIAGYAAKEFVLCCFLHTSANVEAGDGGRGLFGGLATSKVRLLMVSWDGRGLVWGASWIGTWSDLTCSHLIASSSSGAEASMGGCSVGASSDLDAARPCRLLMSFQISYE